MKIRISKDKFARHIAEKYDKSGNKLDPNYQEIKMSSNIYHMDYDNLTGVGAFFSKPTHDRYLMSEESDVLLQLNFFNKSLDCHKTKLVFSPLTSQLNDDMFSESEEHY
jgi:hypothetical protein